MKVSAQATVRGIKRTVMAFVGSSPLSDGIAIMLLVGSLLGLGFIVGLVVGLIIGSRRSSRAFRRKIKMSGSPARSSGRREARLPFTSNSL